MTFLALALYTRRTSLRIIWLFLCFTTLESYVPAALLLFMFGELSVAAKEAQSLDSIRLNRSAVLRAFRDWSIALASYWLLQKVLVQFTTSTDYRLNFGWEHFWGYEKAYLKLLWAHSFYKDNWLSSALEWLALVFACGLWNRRYPGQKKTLLLWFLIPTLSIQYCVFLDYIAPRATHAGTVLKAALVGVLLLGLAPSIAHAGFKKSWGRWVIFTLIFVAYAGHYYRITSNRLRNGELLTQRAAEIEAQLKTCESPCVIHAGGLEKDLVWDWMMTPVFHRSFVEWVNARSGAHKRVQVVE